jgi:NarL family two-component system response regulator LiaR
MTGPIRVLVTDDHTIVRKGICALLQTERDIEVAGEAQNGQEAVSLAQVLRPHVILMDLAMPGIDGIEATRRILAYQPEARILVLTSYAGEERVLSVIKAGAAGYLRKASSPQELVQAIQRVHRGESWFDPAIAGRFLQTMGHPPSKGTGAVSLTEREVEVLRLVASGRSNQQISRQLGISNATVRSHVSNILAKLNLTNRTQAALYALRQGLASLDEIQIRMGGPQKADSAQAADG